MINFTLQELKVIYEVFKNLNLGGYGHKDKKTMQDVEKKLEKIDFIKLASNQIKKTATKMPKKEMKLEDYLDEQQEIKITKELNEDAATIIGSILGYTGLGLIAAFGGSLLTLGGISAVKGLKGIWKKIFKTGKQVFKPSSIIQELKKDSKVKQIKEKSFEDKRKYQNELKYLYVAISNKGWNQAKEEFDKLQANIKNNPDVHKAIISDIVRVLKMPPIYIQSPGNTSYRIIKKILGIKVARAAAAATEMALKKHSSEENY